MSVGAWLFYTHRTHALSETDTIVLADFDNKTGDTVFDGTLRQGLSVQLEQSPFLSIVSDQQIQQTLQMMGKKSDAKLTPEIARELCQRTASAAVLDGSIAQVGTPYLLTLKAVNCSNGETLASTEAQASDKNHVLDALGKTASEMRNKLGESLSTVQKYHTPLEQATTASLEALQAYSLAQGAFSNGEYAAVVPLLQRAIRFDPNFALAYALLGDNYVNLGETGLATRNYQKAYELRERVSEREKLYIESDYYQNVTGDLEKAHQVYEVWAETYPRDFVAPANLGFIGLYLGEYDKALAEFRESFRLAPSSWSYSNVVTAYIYLDHLQEAQTALEDAHTINLDSPSLYPSLYLLAFLKNDAAGMAQQISRSAGKPGVEDVLLGQEGDTAAFYGRIARAREFYRQAVASAERAGLKEKPVQYEVDEAVQDALYGYPADAKRLATAALAHSMGRYEQSWVALALALAAESRQAEILADDLAERFPEDTIVRFNYLPTIRAQLALNRNNSTKATETLQVASPYELGAVWYGVLYPVYVRGQAFLSGHRGSEAATEFQKILDHRGIVGNEPIGALARLQLGRAYSMQGDTAKAKAKYQDFLTLWKGADPDIPILKQAKAEYAKLQ